jgi:molybdenum cofactor synthesis domain-containing protein
MLLAVDAMESGELTGVAVAVVTVSDSCSAGTREDVSGARVAAVLRAAGAAVTRHLVADDAAEIAVLLRGRAAADTPLVLTTGGTGLSPRDVTPEATLAVCDRLAPGLAELLRADGARHTPFAALSRGVAGVAGGTLIVNLPGSPAGAESSARALLPLLPHALRMLRGDGRH